MNDILDVIKQRTSTKKFKDTKVDKQLIDKIIEAGVYSASGQNKQPAIILAITNKEIRDKVAQLNADVMNAKIDPFYNAPVVLVVLADRSSRTYVYDGSIVMANMMLEASSLGLGCCWIHRAQQVFDSPQGKEILQQAGILGDYEGIANLVVGYPDDSIKPIIKKRKDNWVYHLD